MKKRLKENEVIIIQPGEAMIEHAVLETCMTNINSMLRAMHLWFHSAHNTVYGMPFAGDHFELYNKIYTEIQEEIDGFIEKTIGLTNNQNMGCSIMITSAAESLLKSLASPSKLEGCEIASTGRDIVEAYLELLEVVYKKLTESQDMTLGLDDMISSSANRHEGYYYLLNQRATKER
jgi:DNA-binding ferritin-like protein